MVVEVIALETDTLEFRAVLDTDDRHPSGPTIDSVYDDCRVIRINVRRLADSFEHVWLQTRKGRKLWNGEIGDGTTTIGIADGPYLRDLSIRLE